MTGISFKRRGGGVTTEVMFYPDGQKLDFLLRRESSMYTHNIQPAFTSEFFGQAPYGPLRAGMW